MALNSPSSSPSIYTARGSSRSSFSTLRAISPMSSDLNDPTVSIKNPQYREAKQISDEISAHATVYFDERIYIQGLTLLSDVFLAGVSQPNTVIKPACIPSPKYLQIASTLLVHPLHTTRAPDKERLEVTSRSITLLRNVLLRVGARNARLDQAFSFDKLGSAGGRNTRRGRIAVDEGESNSDEEQENGIKGVISKTGLWKCAKDFWHIVGWSFNCSVKYPKRWRYWKVLLEYLLDVLDADWHEREALDEEKHQANLEQNPGATPEHKMLKHSLLVGYLGEFDYKYSSTPVRRIIKSAFADGSPQSLKDFPEIFENETKERKKRKWDERMDVVDRDFGDCDEEEDGDVTFESSEDSSEPHEKPNKKGIPTYSSTIGDPDAIMLRQQVMTLLSRVSFFLPEAFAPIPTVYDFFDEFIRPLPVPSFSLLLSPSRLSPFPSELLVSLIQIICVKYLPLSAPLPKDVLHAQNDSLSQTVMEICYLPRSPMTSSIEDSAKYSILVENLLRLFLTECDVSHTPQLDEAIESGIKAREKNIKVEGRRRGDAAAKREEDITKLFLEASSGRLRSLLDWIEVASAEA